MPAVGTKNKYGETWDGTQWNDPADQFMASINPPPRDAAPPDDGSFRFRPGESTGAAMLRYGGNELLGAARSPIDALKGLLHMPGAVVQGWTEAIPALVSDPALLAHAPQAVKEAVSYFAMHPTELGSALGQAVIGKATPAVTPAVTAAVAPAVAEGTLAATRGLTRTAGRATAAVGRGAEAVGGSAPLRHAGTWGAGGAMLHGNPLVATGLAAAPAVLRGAGRLAQRAGGALTDLSGSDALASTEGLVEALQRRVSPPVAPTRAALMEAGESRFMAGRRAAAAQQAAREGASGVSPDFGERVPVRVSEPVPQAEPGDFSPWEEPPPPPPPEPPPPPAPSSLDALRQRTGTGWRPAETAPPAAAPVAPWDVDTPAFTHEGSAHFGGEAPPGPAARGFSAGPRTTLPDRPVAPWEVEPTPFEFEGTGNMRPGEFPPGPAAPGFDISPTIGAENAGADLTSTLKARTTGRRGAGDRGAGGRYARKTSSRTLLDDLKASLRDRGVEPEE